MDQIIRETLRHPQRRGELGTEDPLTHRAPRAGRLRHRGPVPHARSVHQFSTCRTERRDGRLGLGEIIEHRRERDIRLRRLDGIRVSIGTGNNGSMHRTADLAE